MISKIFSLSKLTQTTKSFEYECHESQARLTDSTNIFSEADTDSLFYYTANSENWNSFNNDLPGPPPQPTSLEKLGWVNRKENKQSELELLKNLASRPNVAYSAEFAPITLEHEPTFGVRSISSSSSTISSIPTVGCNLCEARLVTAYVPREPAPRVRRSSQKKILRELILMSKRVMRQSYPKKTIKQPETQLTTIQAEYPFGAYQHQFRDISVVGPSEEEFAF